MFAPMDVSYCFKHELSQYSLHSTKFQHPGTQLGGLSRELVSLKRILMHLGKNFEEYFQITVRCNFKMN